MNIAAKIQIRSIFTLANNSTRVSNLCGRKADKIYGVEEGHGVKNEVRGEKWIKRHRIHRNVRYFFLIFKLLTKCSTLILHLKIYRDKYILENPWSEDFLRLPKC